MGRSILAVIAGVVFGGILVWAVEKIGHAVYPLPEGFDPTDMEQLKVIVQQLPVGALLFVLLAWAVGSLGGGALAAWLARRAGVNHALIVGGILMLFSIINMFMIPHPTWFWIAGLLVFLPAAYLGARIAERTFNA